MGVLPSNDGGYTGLDWSNPMGVLHQPSPKDPFSPSGRGSHVQKVTVQLGIKGQNQPKKNYV
jgi:hypothetical protein